VDLGIKGKKALITGTGKGIGYGIASILAKEGVRVAIVSRNKDYLEELMIEMGGVESGHYSIVCDLAKEDSPKKVIKELETNFGQLDILVNNVGGTLGITDPYCSLEDWRKVNRLNFEVPVEFNNLIIPVMKKNKWGRIVNICSTASMENNGPVTYCAIKAAFLAYSRSMGRVVAKDGIVMTALLPGAVFTESGHWASKAIDSPEHVEKYLKERCPLGKFGTIYNIGYMAAFLCSELAEFCQGSVVPVDGGQSRHYFSQ